MIVDGRSVDLSGLEILPGLINAHDHLDFALFPRLGRGPYNNATEWAHDIYRPHEDPVRLHLQVPKEDRLVWGGLRNLMAGVTIVSHHDPWHPVFDRGFPVRVIRNYGWAHSLEFTPDVKAAYDQTPPGAPFLIHLAEGTDQGAANEIFRLDECGALHPKTVLIHAVGLGDDGWRLVREKGASVICCPRSNLFLLGKTIDPKLAQALGTDSPITACGDILDEIRSVRETFDLEEDQLQRMTGSAAAKVLGVSQSPDDWIAVPAFGEPPQLVVIAGTVRLISPRLTGSEKLEGFSRLKLEGRPPVLIRGEIGPLFERTRRCLSTHGDVRLGGRLIEADL
jgi:cytosine/adenosine deaminase-related metal-dependent hydrolase